MRMRMMTPTRPRMTSSLTFFHQYRRVTFCDVTLKCCDCGDTAQGDLGTPTATQGTSAVTSGTPPATLGAPTVILGHPL